MANELFADSLIGIQISGEVIKLDFASHVVHEGPNPPPVLKEGEEPQQIVRQRIVLPIGGFAQGFGMQEAVINKLIADGVLQRTDPQAAPSAAAPTAAVPPKNFS